MQPIASTRHTIILLAILAAVSFASYSANAQRSAGRPSNLAITYAVLVALELFLARFIVRGLRGISLRELVGRFSWLDLIIAAAFWFVARYGLLLLRRAMNAHDDRTSGLLPSNFLEQSLWVGASITAGVVEELVFRGYLQRQFAAWTQSIAAGVVLQAIAFGASHGYQGVKSMVIVAAYGLLFGLLAWWRRSLVPGMLAHAWTDVFSGLLRS